MSHSLEVQEGKLACSLVTDMRNVLVEANIDKSTCGPIGNVQAIKFHAQFSTSTQFVLDKILTKAINLRQLGLFRRRLDLPLFHPIYVKCDITKPR